MTDPFWKHADVRTADECWRWRAGHFSKGYGAYGDRGKTVGAHRYAYQLTHGEIPTGLFVCHTCDVRDCVNPAHLFIGTHEDNMRDMVAKGRSTSGRRCVNTKLTEADVLAIRRSCGKSSRQLAREYGVGKDAILAVLRRKTWAAL